jgi:hypothetical protein
MSLPPPSSFLELRHASTDHAIFVVVPERRFIAIDGVGEPGGADFRMATVALRTVMELLLARLRREGVATGTRQGVVECVWWPAGPVPDGDLAAAFADRSAWYWRQLIELPDRATDGQAQAAIDEARGAAGRDVAVRVVTFAEGLAAQLLHVGGHSEEPDCVRRLHAAIAEAGLHPSGYLHTLLLADPDQVPAGRGREIVRQPVA